MSNDVRFDLTARVEVWVTAEEIRWHADYNAAVKIKDADARLLALKGIARDIAEKRVASRSDCQLDITAEVDLSAVNMDRIAWDELSNPTRSIP